MSNAHAHPAFADILDDIMPSRRHPPAHVCRCGMDAPGTCPGWKACPCWATDDDGRVDEAMSDLEVISDSLQDEPRLPESLCRLISEADARPDAELTPLERAVCTLIRERLAAYFEKEAA